jgi:hypothetical protein
VNVSPKAALVAVALSIAPATAHAVWYAQVRRGVAFCVKGKESIDDAWVYVNDRWDRASGLPRRPLEGLDPARGAPRCTLNREGVIGFLIDCGEGGKHYHFRTREHCETFTRTFNAHGTLNVEEFAPNGTANPRRWISRLDTCLELLAKPETIRQAGLQTISTVCECQASHLAAQDSPLPPETATEAWTVCLKEIPAETRAKLILGYKSDRSDRCIINANGVGEVRLGAPLLISTDQLAERGLSAFSDNQGKVTEIYVSAGPCETESGIKVGSSASEVRAAFGDAEPREISISKSGQRIGMFGDGVLQYPGLAFALEQDRVRVIVVGGSLPLNR